MAGAAAEAAGDLGDMPPVFDAAVAAVEPRGLRRGRMSTLQVNVGKLCNMACHHCHVDAGPKRTEIMPRNVAKRVIELLSRNPTLATLDLTGGAPELNPSFRWMVSEARRLGRRVIDRCNLSVLYEDGQADLASFLAAHGVHLIASLPCYGEENVDAQRGRGAFAKSIRALQALNARGYGHGDLRLDLVYNPGGAFLPPPQGTLEARYKEELQRRFGVTFDSLLTITNMPIKRFAAWLQKSGQLDAYMGLLVNHFNPATVAGLMCRSLLSIGWDGRVYDCDFNQMLSIPAAAAEVRTVWDLGDVDDLAGATIATGAHCFGCTAGAGSSCSGALQ